MSMSVLTKMEVQVYVCVCVCVEELQDVHVSVLLSASNADRKLTFILLEATFLHYTL